ncbi:hypothetical protein AURDEDRAFT_162241 [Auricularia subglabra TFB-10046 SS5]|nr:hypothetical protein AURDEDRAFT_162241 [Auricularia subglabra TFB-10046 SS5]
MALPAISINLDTPAYHDSSEEVRLLALHSYLYMTTNQLDQAFECLNRLVADKRQDTNPLLLEAYAMLGQVALARHQVAEACVNFQLATNLQHTTSERLGLQETCQFMVRGLRGILRNPRKISTPPSSFTSESDVGTCSLDALRWWAFGQNMPFIPRTDKPGLALLRKAMKNQFYTPTGDYLLIPTSGEPRLVLPSQALAALSLSSGHLIEQLCTQGLYSQDILERQMGNPPGYPEGHFFHIYEAIMHKQLAPIIMMLKLQPNPLATGLLHLQEDVYGPVLVQMSHLLKHCDARKSLVAARKPVTLDFLKSAEWRQMRMEYRALVGSETCQTAFVTREQVSFDDTAAARHHVHAR